MQNVANLPILHPESPTEAATVPGAASFSFGATWR